MKLFTTSAILLSLSLPLLAEPTFNLGAYLNTAVGTSEVEEESLANHGHDPNDEFTLQGLELSTSIRLNDWVGAQAAYNFFLDEDDKIDGEWEDAYLNGLLGETGLSYRAGRIFNKTNKENNLHLHAWQFVNSSLLTARFMGEEGLLTESAELSWKLPFQNGPTLSLSYGDAVDEEEESGTTVHRDEAFLTTDIFSTSIGGDFKLNDFHNLNYRGHFSSGTNGYGRTGSTYGVILGYTWRENGQEAGGKSFGVETEWVQNSVNFASEDGTRTGNDKENGYNLTSFYDFGNNWQVAGRFEHIEGTSIIEDTPRLNRTSLALTRKVKFNQQFGGHVRLQYDYVNSSEDESSNTAWLQFQLDFGSGY